MSIILMLGWWYGPGWVWVTKQVGHNLDRIGSVFAVQVLLKSWFSPWKQIVTQSTFRNFFQAALDNLVSRAIGSIIRGTMLLVALLWATAVVVFGVAAIIAWPLVPLSIVILPILTLAGVSL